MTLTRWQIIGKTITHSKRAEWAHRSLLLDYACLDNLRLQDSGFHLRFNRNKGDLSSSEMLPNILPAVHIVNIAVKYMQACCYCVAWMHCRAWWLGCLVYWSSNPGRATVLGDVARILRGVPHTSSSVAPYPCG